MNTKKNKENESIKPLVDRYPCQYLETESPDFLFKLYDGTLIGVEVTSYYRCRNKKGQAITEIPGRLKKGFFLNGKDSIFAPKADMQDFVANAIRRKEAKLYSYRKNNPTYSEFWLVVNLSFFDDVVIDELNEVIDTDFDRVFLYEMPDTITELWTKRRINNTIEAMNEHLLRYCCYYNGDASNPYEGFEKGTGAREEILARAIRYLMFEMEKRLLTDRDSLQSKIMKYLDPRKSSDHLQNAKRLRSRCVEEVIRGTIVEKGEVDITSFYNNKVREQNDPFISRNN